MERKNSQRERWKLNKICFFITIGGFAAIFLSRICLELINKNNLLQREREIGIFYQKKLLEKTCDFSRRSKELAKKKDLLENTTDELYNSIRNLQGRMAKLSVESGELEVNKKSLQDELNKIIENEKRIKEEKEKNEDEFESYLELKEENFKNELDSTRKRLVELQEKNDKLAMELKDVEEKRMIDLDNMMKALVEKEESFKKIVEGKESSLKGEFAKQLENELAKAREENIESFQVKKLKEDIKKIRFAYYYNSGVLYAQNHCYEEAVREYLNALRIDERNAQVYYNLGIIFDGYGNSAEKAIFYYEKYLKLEPDAKDAGQVKKWLEAAKERINQF